MKMNVWYGNYYPIAQDNFGNVLCVNYDHDQAYEFAICLKTEESLLKYGETSAPWNYTEICQSAGEEVPPIEFKDYSYQEVRIIPHFKEGSIFIND